LIDRSHDEAMMRLLKYQWILQLLLLSFICVERCQGDCAAPGTLQEVFNYSTNVVRARYTGENATTACYFEVNLPVPGGLFRTNSIPSYSIEEVFKGNFSVGDVIQLLVLTDTGLTLYPFYAPTPPSDDLLAFVEIGEECWRSDGEFLYPYPTDLQGPRPYQLSGCNIYHS
jgi:hypothetical protein